MSVWGTQGRSNPPAARFNELLDQLKMEFTSQHDRAEGNDQQCKNIPRNSWSPALGVLFDFMNSAY
jgi:hypothetical protein